MKPILLIRGVAATSANACPFRKPALASWTLEGVVKKGSDNPTDGAKKQSKKETGLAIVFSVSTKATNPTHEKRPNNNHDDYAEQGGGLLVSHERDCAPLPENCQVRI